MPQIVLTVLQVVFLLLFYLFVARAVRAVLRDVTESSRQPRRATRPRPARATGARAPASSGATSHGAPAAASAGAGAAGAAAPAGMSQAREQRPAPSEVVVHSPDGKPRVLALDGREITFGRASQSTVPLADPYASERHARVYHDGGAWVVHDLGSTNGTFLNRQRITEPTPIAAGDQLGIGRTVVEVRK